MPLDDTLNEEIDGEDAAAVWTLNYKEAAIYLEVINSVYHPIVGEMY